MLRWLDRRLSALPAWRRARASAGLRSRLGYEETLWTRKVADEEVRRLVRELGPETLSALEVSGFSWGDFGFARYRRTDFPEFDIETGELSERFDLVIAEHVFEHLRHPAQAARNVLSRLLKPGGYVLIVTPFLYQVHDDPIDCTRWTEAGLRYFLEECGFPLEAMRSGSWGNGECVKATIDREYRLFNRHRHSLASDPRYPIVVWVLARAPR
jgi:SAM-dependent methyltransferase